MFLTRFNEGIVFMANRLPENFSNRINNYPLSAHSRQDHRTQNAEAQKVQDFYNNTLTFFKENESELDENKLLEILKTKMPCCNSLLNEADNRKMAQAFSTCLSWAWDNDANQATAIIKENPLYDLLIQNGYLNTQERHPNTQERHPNTQGSIANRQLDRMTASKEEAIAENENKIFSALIDLQENLNLIDKNSELFKNKNDFIIQEVKNWIEKNTTAPQMLIKAMNKIKDKPEFVFELKLTTEKTKKIVSSFTETNIKIITPWIEAISSHFKEIDISLRAQSFLSLYRTLIDSQKNQAATELLNNHLKNNINNILSIACYIAENHATPLFNEATLCYLSLQLQIFLKKNPCPKTDIPPSIMELLKRTQKIVVDITVPLGLRKSLLDFLAQSLPSEVEKILETVVLKNDVHMMSFILQKHLSLVIHNASSWQAACVFAKEENWPLVRPFLNFIQNQQTFFNCYRSEWMHERYKNLLACQAGINPGRILLQQYLESLNKPNYVAGNIDYQQIVNKFPNPLPHFPKIKNIFPIPNCNYGPHIQLIFLEAYHQKNWEMCTKVLISCGSYIPQEILRKIFYSSDNIPAALQYIIKCLLNEKEDSIFC